jgi:ribosomal protein S8
MNRHLHNFIAAFNSAAKTGRWTFVAPLRNKFTLTFLSVLLKEKLIEDFSFVSRPPLMFKGCGIKLGKKSSPYYVPIEIRMKHELVKSVYSVSTPGKQDFMSAERLRMFSTRMTGGGGVVICSSSRLRRLCTASELTALGEGGLVLCVVKIS